MTVTLGDVLTHIKYGKEAVVINIENDIGTMSTLVTVMFSDGSKMRGPEDSIDKHFHRRKAKFMRIL